MIQLSRLEGFYWVARTEGYARAVRSFPYPITQPGVHQQIRRLEEELGTRLFTRVAKDRVVPTAAGRALYDFVAPFLERLPTVVASIQEGRHGGTLRIGAASLLLQQIVPAWLRRLQRQRPDIDVALSELKAPDLELVRRGEIDLLVDYLPSVPPDLEARPVAQLHGFLVLPASHPAARRGAPTLSALRGVPFIAFNADRASRALQLKTLAQHGGPDRERYSADSTESVLAFVAAGLGFSLVPWLDERGPRRPGVVAHALRQPGARFDVSAAWRRGPVHPLVEAALAVAPGESGG